MNWLLRRPKNGRHRTIAQLEREYEYRDQHGKVYSRGKAQNACLFRLGSLRAGTTIQTPAGTPTKNPLTMYVVATGERVETQIRGVEACALMDLEGHATEWHRIRGAQ